MLVPRLTTDQGEDGDLVMPDFKSVCALSELVRIVGNPTRFDGEPLAHRHAGQGGKLFNGPVLVLSNPGY